MTNLYPKENLYKVLDVNADSDISAINSGYARMFERYRNDKVQNLLHVKRKFSQKPGEADHLYDSRMRRQQAHILYVIRTAKEVLSAPKKRADYNLWLKDPHAYQEKQKQAQSEAQNGKRFTIQMPRGETYKGETKDNVPHGKGRLFSSRGALIFDGEWENGVLHGDGTSYDSNGNVLKKGCWKNGVLIKEKAESDNDTHLKNANSQQNTVETFSARPFFLRNLFKAVSREYGITKSTAYQKTDFCGTGEFSRTEVLLNRIGTPSYKGFLWGDVHIPGLQGENDVTWEHVLFPANKKACVDRAKAAYKQFIGNDGGPA